MAMTPETCPTPTTSYGDVRTEPVLVNLRGGKVGVVVDGRIVARFASWVAAKAFAATAK